MTKKEIENISKELFSIDENLVLLTLKKVKSNGKPEILNAVLELYNSTDNALIVASIEDILNNIKDEKSVPYLIEGLKKSKKQQKMLSSFWMSGLDFGKHIDTFVEIFIKADFLTAFDAFTVIDNTESDSINQEVAVKSLNLLMNAETSISKDKKQLFKELVDILK